MPLDWAQSSLPFSENTVPLVLGTYISICQASSWRDEHEGHCTSCLHRWCCQSRIDNLLATAGHTCCHTCEPSKNKPRQWNHSGTEVGKWFKRTGKGGRQGGLFCSQIPLPYWTECWDIFSVSPTGMYIPWFGATQASFCTTSVYLKIRDAQNPSFGKWFILVGSQSNFRGSKEVLPRTHGLTDSENRSLVGKVAHGPQKPPSPKRNEHLQGILHDNLCWGQGAMKFDRLNSESRNFRTQIMPKSNQASGHWNQTSGHTRGRWYRKFEILPGQQENIHLQMMWFYAGDIDWSDNTEI